jgi:hypothetical protein
METERSLCLLLPAQTLQANKRRMISLSCLPISGTPLATRLAVPAALASCNLHALVCGSKVCVWGRRVKDKVEATPHCAAVSLHAHDPHGPPALCTQVLQSFPWGQ